MVGIVRKRKHSFSVFIPGISVPTYTEKELKELNDKANKKFSYKGEEYNEYEATQHQREIERNIRETKRQLIMYKEADSKEDFKITSIKLNQLNKEYKDFSSASGIRVKNERTQQVGFDRSISQKANIEAKKQIKADLEALQK